ncbi:acyl-CoA dehydrogenase family protein [Salinisphaera sp. P385]|uniref:Acyl-CoA dehydrogenase family protein n=1 Tax=Spectribacter acetivorans TaxID=3075603 RepID=A0ABU3B431_9GAMM|nr:acyl-CoA dehydrogenase family protein [Salinisphaera sp. P385]MDT0617209.1 acyl-CoA dehydrogenase family protein [Salinisphaera sp. P385]
MINLENPRRYRGLVDQAQQVAREMFRPISRKYDRAEHEYPKELDTLAALLDGMNDSGGEGAGAGKLSQEKSADGSVVNGRNMSAVLGMTELCWGDVGLALSLPRQGLGNAAISAVANEEQAERFEGCWAAMAITEPGAGSDSAAIRTRAVEDGDDYVLNGEKIYVTAGGRCDTVVVWATLDPAAGRAAIKSFVVPKGTPGMEVVRLDHKLGIRASDTATIRFTDCRVPKENLLGSPEIDTKRSFAGAMKTFDNTRPLVAAMAIGLARASLEETRRLLGEAGVTIDYDRPVHCQSAAAAAFLDMEADYEAARLLTLQAAWMADNSQPNSLQASMAKAKAGRMGTAVSLGCLELIGPLAYTEDTLLEKWARDAKILDIFEGTQQIQLLIVARRLLGKTSSELK